MREHQFTFYAGRHILYVDGVERQYQNGNIYWNGERYEVELWLGYRGDHFFALDYEIQGSNVVIKTAASGSHKT